MDKKATILLDGRRIIKRNPCKSLTTVCLIHSSAFILVKITLNLSLFQFILCIAIMRPAVKKMVICSVFVG